MKRLIATIFLYTYSVTVKFFARFQSVRRQRTDKPTIILTGQFASPRWAAAHLLPVAQSNAFSRIWVVSERQELNCEAITWIEPPAMLVKILGGTVARLFTYIGATIRYRPDWIAGFHLLFNGMLAILLALLLRRRSLYFCVGGPAEVLDGGLQSENRLFGSLKTESKTIEQRLLDITHYSHAIVFMGTQARDYYESRGYNRSSFVNPGGLEIPTATHVPFAERSIDVIFIGRLARIKDIPLFLNSISSARRTCPDIKAVIVGDGDERITLEEQCGRLGLGDNVTFAGYQSNVHEWLSNSKVLMLTSKSEGLSLAIMEAVAFRIPVIAPNIGDLGDAVVNDHTGYLMDSRSPDDFADKILNIISNETTFNRLSENAAELSEKFSTAAAARRWQLFVSQQGGEGSSKCAE